MTAVTVFRQQFSQPGFKANRTHILEYITLPETFIHYRQMADIQANSSTQFACVCLILSHLTAIHITKGRKIYRGTTRFNPREP